MGRPLLGISKRIRGKKTAAASVNLFLDTRIGLHRLKEPHLTLNVRMKPWSSTFLHGYGRRTGNRSIRGRQNHTSTCEKKIINKCSSGKNVDLEG